jgi:hypothetical protein
MPLANAYSRLQLGWRRWQSMVFSVADIYGLIWPGKAEGPIEQGHDRSLVYSWRSRLGEY